MGNEMSGGGHGHDQGGDSHGHSHGGKPCHGHGNPAPAPAPQAHGHSHGGKPCHGHGNPAPAPQAHGHSHGGKPCHGHGGAQSGGHSHGPSEEDLDPQTAKKMKAIELFFKTMLTPKLPLIFEHFHPTPEAQRDSSKDIKSGTFMVPDNSAQTMNRKEFHSFVVAIQRGTANSDGHGIVRVEEAINMERQFLSLLGFGAQAADPDAEVQIPQPLFLRLLSMILGRTCAARYDAIPSIFQEIGLGEMKLPNLPQTDDDVRTQHLRSYSNENILPFLVTFVENAAAENKDSDDKMTRCGLTSVLKSIDDGLAEAKSTNPLTARIHESVKQIPLVQFLDDMKVHPEDREPNSRLVAHFVCSNWATMMLGVDAEAAACVFRQWGIDMVVKNDEPTA